MLGDIAGFACKPGWHITGRPYPFVCIKNRDDLFCLLQFDKAPQMLHDFIHIHHIDDALSDRICVKQRGIDDDSTGFQIFFNKANHLSKQSIFRSLAFPG